MYLLRRYCALIVICLALSWSLLAHAARPLVIAGTEDSLLRYFDQEGNAQGLDVTIIRELMRRMHRDVNIRLFKSTARLERSWQQGLCDMVFTHSYNPGRAEFLLYPKQSHIYLEWHFFVLKSALDRYHYQTFDDLQGLRIGVTKSFSYTPEFWEAANKGMFTLDQVTDNNLNIQKLLQHRIDLWPNSTLGTLYRAQQDGYADQIAYLPKPLKSKPYFNTFVRQARLPDLQALAADYDQALLQMKSDGTLMNIYEEYGFELNPKLAPRPIE